MRIRPYRDEDAPATLGLFCRAVHVTAARDYSREQIAAWAPAEMDLAAWAERRARATTYVAVEGDRVIGFADLVDEGHIDMTYVDPDAGGRGVATTLLQTVTETARGRGATRLTVHASLTARPFFVRRGFVESEKRSVQRAGVTLTNVAMSKHL